jgi:hypothetical protein
MTSRINVMYDKANCVHCMFLPASAVSSLSSHEVITATHSISLEATRPLWASAWQLYFIWIETVRKRRKKLKWLYLPKQQLPLGNTIANCIRHWQTLDTSLIAFMINYSETSVVWKLVKYLPRFWFDGRGSIAVRPYFPPLRRDPLWDPPNRYRVSLLGIRKVKV